MSKHHFPSIYEINARVWRHRFGPNTQLVDIPDRYWEQLASLGINYVWLMGVWQTPANARDYGNIRDLHPAYEKALPDWTPDDVIGSPYAIDYYELHKDLGKPGDLKTLKEKINAAGLRLILDFVPNHFHATSSLIAQYPNVFLETKLADSQKDSSTFYELDGRVFAHGKDPYFDAWQDTVQVNYASEAGRQFMQKQLLQAAQYCDGLRCDMAMLLLPDVFERTWSEALKAQAPSYAPFWPNAIKEVKKLNPDFCFIAEVYWDLEWKLQQQGFDYTYDKRLLDRLLHEPQQAIRNHLKADKIYQNHSIRFLENHDEERILSAMHSSKAQAAAIAVYTLPGMRFFHQGQWEGRKIHLPVQLGREGMENLSAEFSTTSIAQHPFEVAQFETVNLPTAYFYKFLLSLLQQAIFQKGAWKLWGQAEDSPLLIWEWNLDNDRCIIIINYSNNATAFNGFSTAISWKDLFGNQEFHPKNGQIALTLSPYQFVILKPQISSS